MDSGKTTVDCKFERRYADLCQVYVDFSTTVSAGQRTAIHDRKIKSGGKPAIDATLMGSRVHDCLYTRNSGNWNRT